MIDLSGIRLVISDVDGTWTDGSLYFGSDGESLKRFHVSDGMGVRLLAEAGIHTAVVSGRSGGPLRSRLAGLGIRHFALGTDEKAKACKRIANDFDVPLADTAFIGDDINDLPAFIVCGVSIAVANAHHVIKGAADLVLDRRGGEGAFREFAEKLLSAKRINVADLARATFR